MVSTPVQQNQTLSVTSGTDGAKIASGKTTPGATNWYPIDGGIEVDVDTSAAGFTQTPIYVTSIAGDKYHWGTTGASSVYKATPTGFSIQIRWDKGFWDANPLDLQEANSYKWHINWMAFEPSIKTPFPDPQKYYYIVAKHSGKGLAVAGPSNDNNANIVQWDKVAKDNHQFRFQDAGNGYFYIVAKHSGKGIAVAGPSNDNNANIVQWDIIAKDNHQFKLQDAGNGYFYIVAKHSGKGLAVAGPSNDNNASIVQWDITDKDNHKWRLEAV